MSPKRKKSNKSTVTSISRYLLYTGIVCIGLGLLLLTAIFWPVVMNEITYQLQKTQAAIVIGPGEIPKPKDIVITPIDEEFGIVIPKIRANAKIIPNVDPYDSRLYQQALTKGVAHAKGSVFPGRVGNMFIFSHSSVNFFEALRYNSVFYLLDKLEKGDIVDIFMNKEKFTYIVTEKELVDASNISFLTERTNQKLLTLMTCWPPGTTYKRLIVRAILTP